MKFTTLTVISCLAVSCALLTTPVLVAQSDTLSVATQEPAPMPEMNRVPPGSVTDGTFFLLSDLVRGEGAPPYPGLPQKTVGAPIYSVGGLYLVDDSAWNPVLFSGLNPDATVAAIQEQLEPLLALRMKRDSSMTMSAMDGPGVPGDGEVGGEPPVFGYTPRVYGPDELWIELIDPDALWLYHTAHPRLHNTVEGEYYQLASKTNLSDPEWMLGQIITGAYGTNQTDFSPVSVGNNPQMFFRAHHSDTILYLSALPPAFEPVPALNNPGQVGIFELVAVNLTNDITVHYRMSGTASNGVDYTALSGTVTVPASAGYVDIAIVPAVDNVVEGVETVVLTLLPGDEFLIDPYSQSVTNEIRDSSIRVGVSPTLPVAYEPNGPTGAPGLSGQFGLYRSDELSLNPAQTVYYTLSGTASNGVDYSLLSGTYTFPTGVAVGTIDIDPIEDGLLEGTETVTLTLVPTNTYVLDEAYGDYPVLIKDSSTTVAVTFGDNAIEPNTNSPTAAQTGFFSVQRLDDRNPSFNSQLTVHYAISGSAINGVDYTNLSGTVTFAAGATSTNIFVQPLEDDLLEGDETVTITLIPEAYLVDSTASNASLLILDNVSTNTFVTVLNVPNLPIAIDYHPALNSLILSQAGSVNFLRIYTNLVVTNGVLVTNVVVTNWSGIRNVPDEVKVATVKTSAGGFTNSDMFFGSGSAIGWLSANGSVSNLTWCVLTNGIVINQLPLRGSLYVDQTGIFSNHLVAVASDDSYTSGSKGVWRVDALGHPTLLTNLTATHLEGVITLPNDTNRYGPWAGKLLTGDENTGLIYAVAPDGSVTTYNSTALFPNGIYTEDFDLIPANQNLYLCDAGHSTVTKFSASYLADYVGDLMITQAGERNGGAALFIVHWDSAAGKFIIRRILYPGQLEHVSFAPIDLPPLP